MTARDYLIAVEYGDLLGALLSYQTISKRDLNALHEIPDLRAKTLLAFTCKQGMEQLVQPLIDIGADVNFGGANNTTPLQLAALYGHVSICETLVNAGADVNAMDNNGNTPLNAAIHEGHTDICRFLLERGARADLKEATTRWTPLHRASLNGNFEVCKLLIELGADVNAIDISDTSPLFYAYHFNHKEVYDLLIEAGADPDIGKSHNMVVVEDAPEMILSK